MAIYFATFRYHGLTISVSFRFELDDHISVSNDTEKIKDKEDDSESAMEDREMPLSLKKVYLIYQQASQHIHDIKFIIQLLTTTEEYDNTEELQKKIIRYKYTERILYFCFHINSFQCVPGSAEIDC